MSNDNHGKTTGESMPLAYALVGLVGVLMVSNTFNRFASDEVKANTAELLSNSWSVATEAITSTVEITTDTLEVVAVSLADVGGVVLTALPSPAPSPSPSPFPEDTAMVALPREEHQSRGSALRLELKV